MTTPVLATIFQPVSIKRQLMESSGVLQGEVLDSQAEIDDDGKIVTRVTLKPEKWMGEFEESFDEFSVFYPGGRVGDQARMIEGVPKFTPGEHVVLFISKHKEKNWVSNLGLGKYSVQRMGLEKIMVNQVFPTEPSMGQISLTKFYELAEEVKNQKFSFRFKDKYELENEKEMIKSQVTQGGRTIASIEEEEQSSSIDPFWLVFLLGALGVMVGVVRNKAS